MRIADACRVSVETWPWCVRRRMKERERERETKKRLVNVRENEQRQKGRETKSVRKRKRKRERERERECVCVRERTAGTDRVGTKSNVGGEREGACAPRTPKHRASPVPLTWEEHYQKGRQHSHSKRYLDGHEWASLIRAPDRESDSSFWLHHCIHPRHTRT